MANSLLRWLDPVVCLGLQPHFDDKLATLHSIGETSQGKPASVAAGKPKAWRMPMHMPHVLTRVASRGRLIGSSLHSQSRGVKREGR